MKVITYSIPYSEKYQLSNFITSQCSMEEILFFDIETTGFAAQNTILYLIGVLYYEGNEVHIIQWFNEDGNFEKELIMAFHEFSKKFTHLVHFNGLGFDLPYLRQKAALLQLPFSVEESIKQIDIFKNIRSYKKIFHLENMKQVTIEDYLGINRKDTKNGGELIQIYQRYVATGSEEYEKILLLHNHDDLLCMPKVSGILNYCSFFRCPDILNCRIELPEHNHIITNKDNCIHIYFDFSKKQLLQKRILYDLNGIYLNVWETNGFLSVPIIEAAFLHFFDDYKNYYYLPQEDMAIHKSVATYVEPCSRIKATKNNCYVKKQDLFIPCFIKPQGLDTFCNSLKDKQKYITLNSFLSADTHIKNAYIKGIIQAMI